MAVLHKQLSEPLPRPSKFVPGLPERVEQVLIKALAKQSKDRYSDMTLFAETLEQIAQGKLPKTSPIPKPQRTWFKPGQQHWALALAAVGIVCLLGVTGAAFGLSRLVSSFRPVPSATAYEAEPDTSVPITPSFNMSTSLPVDTPTLISASPTPNEITTSTKDGAELAYVLAGEFIMGSDAHEPYFWGAEAPKHDVYLNAFWIYRTEVTNKMYRACVQEKACPHPVQSRSNTRNDYYENSLYGNYPVVYVTYYSALAYCQWIGGRLPTEAEWEKAARGTDGRLFPWGNGELQGNLANFCNTGCPGDEVEYGFDDGYRDTAPVGNYPDGASPYSALDMAGNVLEWVGDWFQIEYYSSSPFENPLGPASGTRRGIRGGSWISARSGLRPAARASLKPDNSLDILGFRCAMVAP